jgi:hypothetical protein
VSVRNDQAYPITRNEKRSKRKLRGDEVEGKKRARGKLELGHEQKPRGKRCTLARGYASQLFQMARPGAVIACVELIGTVIVLYSPHMI